MASEPEPRSRRSVAGWWIAAAALGLPALWVVNRLVPPPSTLGARDGRLAACPDSPNCVNSQADPGPQAIEPLTFTGEAGAALERLRGTVQQLPGARLVEERADYLRFEFRTRVCRFVDDVEFLVDAASRRIHVRSASRVGYSDLGVNRRRVEEIRRRWALP